MRAVIQRVEKASISINNALPKSMGRGLVVLFGVSKQDTDGCSESLIKKLASKTANLRIFADAEGKMNRSASDLGLSIMVVSQFTLFSDTRKGNRPSFAEAADAPFAKEVYNRYVEELRSNKWREFLTGEFGAMMTVEIVNDGPVTIIIDTDEWTREK